MRRSIQRAPTVSVSPCAEIEARITNAATSNTADRSGASDLRTKSANSIEATPFGPNQAMNSFWARGRPVRASDSSSAAGRATSSTNGMKAASAQTEPAGPDSLVAGRDPAARAAGGGDAPEKAEPAADRRSHARLGEQRRRL